MFLCNARACCIACHVSWPPTVVSFAATIVPAGKTPEIIPGEPGFNPALASDSEAAVSSAAHLPLQSVCNLYVVVLLCILYAYDVVNCL
jgi:hypothetical protein